MGLGLHASRVLAQHAACHLLLPYHMRLALPHRDAARQLPLGRNIPLPAALAGISCKLAWGWSDFVFGQPTPCPAPAASPVQDSPTPGSPKYRCWLHWMVINIPQHDVPRGEVGARRGPAWGRGLACAAIPRAWQHMRTTPQCSGRRLCAPLECSVCVHCRL